jgi:hypothetical protein
MDRVWRAGCLCLEDAQLKMNFFNLKHMPYIFCLASSTLQSSVRISGRFCDPNCKYA